MVKPKAARESDAELLIGFLPGAIIYAADDPGADMFVIEDGEVELVGRYGPRERRLALLGPGDFFGEMSLLEEMPRGETARAITECRLLAIDAAAFDQVLRRHPEAALRMIHKLARRLRRHDEATQRAMETASGVLAGAPRGDRTDLRPVAPGSDAAPADAASLRHVASGKRFALAPDRKNIIGRKDPVTGMNPEVDLTPLDRQRSLSRRHACIWWHGGRIMLRGEMGAANGTFVNGKRLAPGEEREIAIGARIRFGLVEMRLYREPDPGGPA